MPLMSGYLAEWLLHRAPSTASLSGSRSSTGRGCSAGWRARSARPAGRSARSTWSRSSASTRSATSRSRPATPPTGRRLTQAVDAVQGARVLDTTDRTFMLHAGGKIEVRNKSPLKTRDDLSMAYTPGVARVCRAIFEDPDKAFQYTIKRNTVAVVSDGTAVLGLGDIGPRAAMPVMEGKAMLFKEFGGVDAFPICLDTQGPRRDRGGRAGDRAGLRRDQPRGHLRARAASRSRTASRPSWTSRCSTTTSTAPRSWSWPRCSTRCRLTGRDIGSLRDRDRRPRRGRRRRHQDPDRGRRAAHHRLSTRAARCTSSARTTSTGACRRSSGRWRRATQPRAPVGRRRRRDRRRRPARSACRGARVMPASALAADEPGPDRVRDGQPDPEVSPEEAARYARILATGRSDYPNQINNVLCFPGVFRGALDVRATQITESMKTAAARAIADIVGDDELREDYIIPSVFNRDVAPAVAAAVAAEARASGTAERPAPSSASLRPCSPRRSRHRVRRLDAALRGRDRRASPRPVAARAAGPPTRHSRPRPRRRQQQHDHEARLAIAAARRSVRRARRSPCGPTSSRAGGRQQPQEQQVQPLAPMAAKIGHVAQVRPLDLGVVAQLGRRRRAAPRGRSPARSRAWRRRARSWRSARPAGSPRPLRLISPIVS